MHKAKTSKLLISVAAVFSLIFGGVVGISAPANAASINGCVSSNWQPNNCGGTGSQAVLTALSPNISGTTGTPITTTTYSYSGCTPSNFKLYAATDTSYSTALAKVAGITFSTVNGQFSGTPTSAISATNYVVVLSCSDSSLLRFSLSVTVTQGTAVPYLTPDSVYIT